MRRSPCPKRWSCSFHQGPAARQVPSICSRSSSSKPSSSPKQNKNYPLSQAERAQSSSQQSKPTQLDARRETRSLSLMARRVYPPTLAVPFMTHAFKHQFLTVQSSARRRALPLGAGLHPPYHPVARFLSYLTSFVLLSIRCLCSQCSVCTYFEAVQIAPLACYLLHRQMRVSA